MVPMRPLIVFALTLALIEPSYAGEAFRVHVADVADRKAVIATVEPVHELVARARIGGTIATLSIKEGDNVAAGAVVAQVADTKLALQMQALDARIASQQSQRDQAKIDYDRVSELVHRGVSTQSQLDQAKTNLDVAERNLTAVKGRSGGDRAAIERRRGACAGRGPRTHRSRLGRSGRTARRDDRDARRRSIHSAAAIARASRAIYARRGR